MKTETLIERTKGEWRPIQTIDGIEIDTTEFNYSGNGICLMDKFNEEAEANAAFICKAVNNYDRLVLENETLKDCLDTYNKLKAVNDSLLSALKGVSDYFPHAFGGKAIPAMQNAREAIKAAEQ